MVKYKNANEFLIDYLNYRTDEDRPLSKHLEIAFEAGKFSIPIEPPVKPEIAELKEILNTAMTMLLEAPELNLCNYDEEQVRELNYAVISTYKYLRDRQQQFSV